MLGLRFWFLILALVTGGLIYFLTVVSLPFNALSLDVKMERFVKSTLPEGWGFFTRNPRERDIMLYFKRKGEWKKNPNWPISSPVNICGINRKPRAQSVEMALLLKEIPDSVWQTSDVLLMTELKKESNVINVKNPTPVPLLTDTIAIVAQEPIPWSWRNLKNNFVNPYHFVILKIK